MELTGPVLLFGGPYSNLQATKAMQAEASRRAIPASNVICTGDVVAYCGSPAETVSLIREWGCHVVAGNCEEQLAAGADDCGCGFEDGTVCDALSAEWYAFASRQIDKDARAWMAGLPRSITFTYEGRRWAVVHGGAEETSRFIWPTDMPRVKEAEIAVLEARRGPLDGVICGHSGIAFVQNIAGKIWLNAGVIGMPANDGTQETEFAVLDQGPHLMRLTYDAPAAAAAMTGRAAPYREALLSGLWPSEDVLPPDMRREPVARAV